MNGVIASGALCLFPYAQYRGMVEIVLVFILHIMGLGEIPLKRERIMDVALFQDTTTSVTLPMFVRRYIRECCRWDSK